MIVDLSAHGMGLRLTAPVHPGEVVTVESADDVAFGIARYCRPAKGGLFRAGLEIFHVMPNADEQPHSSVIERLFSH